MSPRKKAAPRVREEPATYAVEAPPPGTFPEAKDYVSERDYEILMGLMENPPPPNEALIRTLRHHRDFVRSHDRSDED